jgi:dihydrofolate reductase
MPELLVDFITSLDGYAAAEGWPGWWGLQGSEYLAWLGEQPEADYAILMGATTYRVMSRFAAEDEPGTEALAGMSKVVFSSTLSEPLAWANTQLVAADAVEAVREMKANGSESMRTIGSLTCAAHSSQPAWSTASAWLCFRSLPDAPVGSGSTTATRCRSRHGRQPHIRRTHPAARVRPDDSGWAARQQHGEELTASSWTIDG